jgi:hypothetical protein
MIEEVNWSKAKEEIEKTTYKTHAISETILELIQRGIKRRKPMEQKESSLR